MDKKLQSEKNVIYEIFRACRLCGAGGGYKMPIITNLPLDDAEVVELRQKILETVQIEVNEDDKMPPLICELCVDKVNDFYEYLEMCRQTNKHTRLRLGLPMQPLSQGASDSGDCILGVTEPLFANEDSGDEPLSRQKSRSSKKKAGPASKKRMLSPEPEPKTRRSVKEEPYFDRHSQSRSFKDFKRPASHPVPSAKRSSRNNASEEMVESKQLPRRNTRHSSSDDDIKIKDIVKHPSKGILKKEVKVQLEPLEERGTKRHKDEKKTTGKKVKIATERDWPVRPSPKSAPPPAVKRPPPPPPPRCQVCQQKFTNTKALDSHYRRHAPTFTDQTLACNACRDWFPTGAEASAHHEWHGDSNPYSCKDCYDDFDLYSMFRDHITKNKCIEVREVSDVKCEQCWQLFPTLHLLDTHHCEGEGGRPGGTCIRCKRVCSTQNKLRDHRASCNVKPKIAGCTVSVEVARSVKPLEVRTERCDGLLVTSGGEHYDVANVRPDYGLDRNREYPFMPCLQIKKETTFEGMVNIKDDLLPGGDTVAHWDSDTTNTDGDEDTKKGDSLDQSPKKRKIQTDITNAEHLLDSLLNEEDLADSAGKDLNVEPSDSGPDKESESNQLTKDERDNDTSLTDSNVGAENQMSDLKEETSTETEKVQDGCKDLDSSKDGGGSRLDLELNNDKLDVSAKNDLEVNKSENDTLNGDNVTQEEFKSKDANKIVKDVDKFNISSILSDSFSYKSNALSLDFE